MGAICHRCDPGASCVSPSGRASPCEVDLCAVGVRPSEELRLELCFVGVACRLDGRVNANPPHQAVLQDVQPCSRPVTEAAAVERESDLAMHDRGVLIDLLPGVDT